MLREPIEADDASQLIDELIDVFVSRRHGRPDAQAMLRARAALTRLAAIDPDGRAGEALDQLAMHAELLLGETAGDTRDRDLVRVAALATIGELRAVLF